MNFSYEKTLSTLLRQEDWPVLDKLLSKEMFYECQAIYRHSSILITDISVNRIVNKEETFLIPCSQSWG